MWKEFTPIPLHLDKKCSVLDSLPPQNAQTIVENVLSCIKNVSKSLETQAEVDWYLDVLCYGLKDSSTVIGCVTVYCDWLSVLLPYPSSNIPKFILEEPNLMSKSMFKQLYSLFSSVDPLHINTETETACMSVLHMLENIGQQSSVMDRSTWDCLLQLLLAGGDLVLSPPGPGGPLCHTAVSVLCHTWLASCLHHFPSPTMWRTFQSVAVNWRHRSESEVLLKLKSN